MTRRLFLRSTQLLSHQAGIPTPLKDSARNLRFKLYCVKFLVLYFRKDINLPLWCTLVFYLKPSKPFPLKHPRSFVTMVNLALRKGLCHNLVLFAVGFDDACNCVFDLNFVFSVCTANNDVYVNRKLITYMISQQLSAFSSILRSESRFLFTFRSYSSNEWNANELHLSREMQCGTFLLSLIKEIQPHYSMLALLSQVLQ